MAKEELVKMVGTVVEASPGAKFKVILENGHQINATISGKIRKNNIQILLNDEVEVELSVYDLTVGRIVYRR